MARHGMERWIVGALIVVAGLAVACGSGPAPSGDGATAFATFHEGGIGFTYPAAWRAFHHEVVSSFSSSIAELGTVDVPDPCVRTPNAFGGEDIACTDRYRLVPDSLVVQVSANGFPGFDIVTSRPPLAVAVVVGGRRAFLEQGRPEDPAVGADVVITWTIDRPEAAGNSYTIRATIRGPDIDAIKAELQRLILSVRFDPAA